MIAVRVRWLRRNFDEDEANEVRPTPRLLEGESWRHEVRHDIDGICRDCDTKKASTSGHDIVLRRFGRPTQRNTLCEAERSGQQSRRGLLGRSAGAAAAAKMINEL
ncbi:MAG TPA: hypothetical protein PLY87_30385 [Planctomycetaceae bacterium]|nr:hypothetical protein [Planctomycetaceae bacterium]HQZ69447.1 hypothetical protein [Planctomycetaceae bacterium]